MIENIGDVIAIVGTDGMTKYQSPNVEKWFGWKPEDIIGTKGWDKMHPEDVERIQKEFSKVLEKETASIVEYRFKCKDGNYKWIKLTAVNCINNPVINGVLLNYYDITELKMVEFAKNERLKELNCLYGISKIIEIPDLSIVEIFRKVIGLVSATWQYPEITVCRIIVDGIEYKEPNFKKTKWMQSSEIKVGGKNAGIIEICYLEKMPDFDEGSFLKEERLVIDAVAERMGHIIERKQAEYKIKKLNEELEQRVLDRTSQLDVTNKELEAFSYSVSHDLRAPLRTIDGFSKIILEDYFHAFDKQGKHYLQRIRAGSQEMGKLIDDILSLSRIGRKSIKKEAVNIIDIANEVYKMLENEWKNRKINFVVGDCPIINCDANLIKIVFVNLFSNAIKFTKNITIAEIEFGCMQKDEITTFFVKDNGVGFDMKYADKLFSPFQRLHSTEEFEGTGIGLAIIKRIINRHDGKIWIESKINKGTTVYFTL